jgi:hypothetical protein
VSYSCQDDCPDITGCPTDQSPFFIIRRRDTKPDLILEVSDCDGPIDLTGLVVEISMWALTKLKKTIAPEDTIISFADGIGFEQVMVGDVILVSRSRAIEQMLIVGFDEKLKLIQVQRGYHGSRTFEHPKGSVLKIFRVLNASALTEMEYMDIAQIDGSVKTNVLVKSKLVYEWQDGDTCLPGCFWAEFKLIKMSSASPFAPMYLVDPSSISGISIISYSTTDLGCALPTNSEWVRRFPTCGEGLLIQIQESPTTELLLGA